MKLKKKKHEISDLQITLSDAIQSKMRSLQQTSDELLHLKKLMVPNSKLERNKTRHLSMMGDL